MDHKKLLAPATLFAAGAFVTPAGATVVDITASDLGTSIDLVGDSTSEYLFYSNYVGATPTTDTALQGKALSGNRVGGNSATPYFPAANDPSLNKTQTPIQDGYYGLYFRASVPALSGGGATGPRYTGYALVDRGGTHISDITFQAAPVPEPETWAMMLIGLGAAGAVARQRRRAVAAA